MRKKSAITAVLAVFIASDLSFTAKAGSDRDNLVSLFNSINSVYYSSKTLDDLTKGLKSIGSRDYLTKLAEKEKKYASLSTKEKDETLNKLKATSCDPSKMFVMTTDFNNNTGYVSAICIGISNHTVEHRFIREENIWKESASDLPDS